MQVTRKLSLAGVAFCALTLAACGGGLSVGGSAGAGGGSLGSANAAPPETSGNGSGGDQTAGNTGSGGSGSGGTGTGDNSRQAGNLTGNGTVTVTAGGTTVATPPLLTGPLAPVGNVVNTVGQNLATAGNALLPTQVTSALQGVTSGLPLTANIANNTLGGSPTQPLGVSVLSNTPASGSILSANLLSAGQTAGVTVNPAGIAPALTGIAGSPTGLVSPVLNTATSALAPVTSALSPVTSALPITTTLGNATLTGGTAQQPIGVSLLSPTQATGTAATVGVLSGGNVATAALGNTGIGGVTGAATGAVGNVLNSTASLANANVLNQNIITGPNPIIGASAASAQQKTGSVATVGLLSGGQPVSLGLGGKQILPLAK